MVHILCEKYQKALGVAEFERGKNFGDLFLAKLKTAITFAPVIRMTIIIYAFGVEENLHDVAMDLKYYCPIFLNFS